MSPPCWSPTAPRCRWTLGRWRRRRVGGGGCWEGGSGRAGRGARSERAAVSSSSPAFSSLFTSKRNSSASKHNLQNPPKPTKAVKPTKPTPNPTKFPQTPQTPKPTPKTTDTGPARHPPAAVPHRRRARHHPRPGRLVRRPLQRLPATDLVVHRARAAHHPLARFMGLGLGGGGGSGGCRVSFVGMSRGTLLGSASFQHP